MIRARKDEKPTHGFIFNKIHRDYALKDKIVFIDEKKEHFYIEKVPYVVQEFDIDKEIGARCAGQDIKSICERISRGEIVPSDNGLCYGDHTSDVETGIEFQEKKLASEKIIDSVGNLSNEDLKNLAELAKMSKEDFKKYIDNLVSERFKKEGAPDEESKKVEAPVVDNKEVKE